MWIAEDVLAVPRWPEIFRRLRDARNGQVVPAGAVEHFQTAAGDEAERARGVPFDDNLVVACGIGECPCDDIDFIDFGMAYRRYSDDPSDEFGGSDRHR